MNSPMKQVLAALLAAAILGGCEPTEQDRNKPSSKDNEITAEQMETVMEWWDTQPKGLCSLTNKEAYNFAGGIAAGTALTAHIAGDSVFVLMSTTGAYFGVIAPAVAPVLAVGGGIAALTYVGIKIYCMGQASVGHRISEESEK